LCRFELGLEGFEVGGGGVVVGEGLVEVLDGSVVLLDYWMVFLLMLMLMLMLIFLDWVGVMMLGLLGLLILFPFRLSSFLVVEKVGSVLDLTPRVLDGEYPPLEGSVLVS